MLATRQRPSDIPKIDTRNLERRYFEQRISDLRLVRQSWFQTWVQITDNIAPTRGMYYEQPGWGRQIDHRRVIDGHAQRCLRTLGAGMLSGLTSPSSPWFKLGVSDPDGKNNKLSKIWLQDVTDRIMGVFERSNIYLALNNTYEEGGGFGTAAFAVLKDKHTVIRAKTFTAGDYFLACGPDGRVNTFGREFWFTVGQLVEEFGYSNCTLTVQNLFEEGRSDKWIKVFYLIEPNNDRIPHKEDFHNMAFRALYWEQGAPQDQFLRIGGFKNFPILSPRWEVIKTADPYGKGVGWDALGDTKMLHKLQRDKLIALDKVINPPLQVDANVDGAVNSLPGGVTRFSQGVPNAGMKAAYQINPDFEHLELMIEKTKQAISETFYTDLFKMMEQLDQHRMTAEEVATRNRENLLQLGPVLSRLESELLDPLIHITFESMYEQGLIPPPPPQLQGMLFQVEYTSPLLQAQKIAATSPILQVSAFLGQLVKLQVEGAQSDILDNYDLDQMAQKYGEFTGLDPSIARSPEQLNAIRKAKSDEMQQEKVAQRSQQMVEGAQKMSQTPLNTGSALDQYIQNQKNAQVKPGVQ